MRTRLSFLIGFLLLSPFILFSQSVDSIYVEYEDINTGEVLDLIRFEEFGYIKLRIVGKDIKDNYFMLTSREYWNGQLTEEDTITSTKSFNWKIKSDTVNLRIMTKKINRVDTVKMMFFLPMFSVIKKYKTTQKETYSLRKIVDSKGYGFHKEEKIVLLAYSLPYEDPQRPGYLFYCELTKDGIPPSEWWQKYGIEHYIVFDFRLLK